MTHFDHQAEAFDAMIARSIKNIRWHMKHCSISRDEAMRKEWEHSVMGPVLKVRVLQGLTDAG